jgi:hypothetical protein
MAWSNKTRELKRQRNDQDVGPSTKRLSFILPHASGRWDGEVLLCQQTISPACSSCRVLLARGITGPVETWREGVPSACMRGDVEKVAGLTVKEPDRGAIAFARWNAFPSSPVAEEVTKYAGDDIAQPCPNHATDY